MCTDNIYTYNFCTKKKHYLKAQPREVSTKFTTIKKEDTYLIEGKQQD